jgi:hypothetical protein
MQILFTQQPWSAHYQLEIWKSALENIATLGWLKENLHKTKGAFLTVDFC